MQEYKLTEKSRTKLAELLKDDIEEWIESVPDLDWDAIEDWAETATEYDLPLNQCTSDIANTHYATYNEQEYYQVLADHAELRRRVNMNHDHYADLTVAITEAIESAKLDALEDLLEQYGEDLILVATGLTEERNYPSPDEEIAIARRWVESYWEEFDLEPLT